MILKLINILILLETGNGVKDNGDAIGPLQIRPAYVKDVNRIAKKFYNHEDARDLDNAINMAVIYLRYYGKKMYGRTGRKPTVYDLAMIHRLGPFGYMKKDHDYGLRACNLFNENN